MSGAEEFLLQRIRQHDGVIPVLGSAEWLDADDDTRVISALRAALAWLDHYSADAIWDRLTAEQLDVERQVRDRVKGVSLDVSAGMTWTRVGPSYAELVRCRLQPG